MAPVVNHRRWRRHFPIFSHTSRHATHRNKENSSVLNHPRASTMFTVDCSADCVSEYLPWSTCDSVTGVRSREVRVSTPQAGSGKACLRRLIDNATWSEWSAWGAGGERCSRSSSVESRIRTIVGSTSPADEGSCRPQRQHRPCDFGEQICHSACPTAASQPQNDNIVAMIRPISRWYAGHPALGTCGSAPGKPLLSACSNSSGDVGGARLWFNNTDNALPHTFAEHSIIVYFIVDDVGKVSLAIQTNTSYSISKSQILDVKWFSTEGAATRVEVQGGKGVVSARCIGEPACSGSRVTLRSSGDSDTLGVLFGHFPPEGMCVDIKTVEGFADAIALTVNVNESSYGNDFLAIKPVGISPGLLKTGLRICATLCGRSGVEVKCTPSKLQDSGAEEKGPRLFTEAAPKPNSGNSGFEWRFI